MRRNLSTVSSTLTYKQVFTRFINFAYKSVISRMLEFSASFGGTYLLSALGSDYLAASGLINSTQNFLIRTGRLSLFGMPSLLKEAKDDKDVAEVLQQSRIWSVILSLPIIVVYSVSGSILIKLGQNETISYLAQDFLRAYTWGVPATLIQTSNLQYFYFRKDLWTACLINFLQTMMTLSFGYLLINGGGELAAYGAAGLGHANALAAWITCLGSTWYIAKYHGLFKFDFCASLPKLKKLIKQGLPIGIQQGSELFALTVAVQMSGLISKEALAATEASSQWISYISIPMQTLAQAANTLVSIELKENRPMNAKKYGDCSALINMIIPALTFGLFLGVGKELAGVFIKNHDNSSFDTALALETARKLLIINGAIQIVDAFRTGYSGSLRGYDYVKVPAALGILNLCVIAIPLSYVCGFTAGWGVEGIFSARIVPAAIDAALLAYLWRKISRQNTTIENKFSEDIALDSKGGSRSYSILKDTEDLESKSFNETKTSKDSTTFFTFLKSKKNQEKNFIKREDSQCRIG